MLLFLMRCKFLVQIRNEQEETQKGQKLLNRQNHAIIERQFFDILYRYIYIDVQHITYM
jgi:hypothetical protein